VVPVVRGAAGTGTIGGIAVAHSTNLQVQTGSLEGTAHAVCRRLP
jgi:hypothetical protein